MIESLKEVLDAGYVVSNPRGGYMRKESEGNYLFQTHYRSSNYGTFLKMSKKFIAETNGVEPYKEEEGAE